MAICMAIPTRAALAHPLIENAVSSCDFVRLRGPAGGNGKKR